MNHDPFDDHNRLGPDDNEERLDLQIFLQHTVRQLLDGLALLQLLSWAAEHGPELVNWPEPGTDSALGQMLARDPPEQIRVEQGRLLRLIAWQVARALPLPQRRFKALALAMPGRNEPCLCGSLKKFKQCCSAIIDRTPTFTAEDLAPYLFLEMPRPDWARLPTQVPAVWVISTLRQWLCLEERSQIPRVMLLARRLPYQQDALQLMQVWADLKAPWPAKNALIYDMLGDLYLDLGQPAERRALAERMVQRGDKVVQALGWERLALMAFDDGQMEQAFEALHHTQRLDPDNPRTAILEITLLSARGDSALAQERAGWHARRLARLPEADQMEPTIELLNKVAELGPRQALGRMSIFDDSDDDDDDDTENADDAENAENADDADDNAK